MSASDIQHFFNTSTRDENDSANRGRENTLPLLSNPPQEYLAHPEFGASWRDVSPKWNAALYKVAEKTNVPAYTSTEVKLKAGRKFHYDTNVMYYNGATLVGTRTIEFKYGGRNICNLPQFLSLPAKFKLFPVTYDEFWYDNGLPAYIACDAGITLAIPPREEYLKSVTSTTYSEPLFAQFKERELFFQKEKNAVVNASITDYLTTHGKNINIAAFSEKVKSSQTDKIYLLWSNGDFNIDMMSDAEMSAMEYHSIKNGNVLQVKAGNTMYGLLLRWRNHKGILNPAWQISMKRLA